MYGDYYEDGRNRGPAVEDRDDEHAHASGWL